MSNATNGTKPSTPLVLLLLICAPVLALYGSSLDREFIFDDHEVILAQPVPGGASDLLRVFGERHIVDLPYYRPVTRASLLWQKRVHGERPSPFHAFNAVLMAAIAALEAASANVSALNQSRQERGLPVTGFYLGLHVGPVYYGNIGSLDRLDFTVVGQAVNELSRIEGMCRSLDRTLVTSAAFREAAVGSRDRLVSLGRYALRGVARPQELFTLDPECGAAPRDPS